MRGATWIFFKKWLRPIIQPELLDSQAGIENINQCALTIFQVSDINFV